MDYVTGHKWLVPLLLVSLAVAGLTVSAAPASAYVAYGAQTVTGTYTVNGSVRSSTCITQVSLAKDLSSTFAVVADGNTRCSTGNVNASGNTRIVDPYTQPNTTIAQGPSFNVSPLNGGTPHSSVVADMGGYPTTSWFTGRIDVTLTLLGVGAKWVAATVGNSASGPGGCVLITNTAYCSLQSAPYHVGGDVDGSDVPLPVNPPAIPDSVWDVDGALSADEAVEIPGSPTGTNQGLYLSGDAPSDAAQAALFGGGFVCRLLAGGTERLGSKRPYDIKGIAQNKCRGKGLVYQQITPCIQYRKPGVNTQWYGLACGLPLEWYGSKKTFTVPVRASCIRGTYLYRVVASGVVRGSRGGTASQYDEGPVQLQHC